MYRYEWGKKGLLEKLIHLWRINTQPITMAVVTKVAKCDRRAAAFVFYTLMGKQICSISIMMPVDCVNIYFFNFRTQQARTSDPSKGGRFVRNTAY